MELGLPLRSYGLTSGPSQPEFQGFTPLATSSLVDAFSGDFSYNLPLLEIEGYPLNLVYRSTSNIEEEGSWVGYGWNLNLGTLNRLVRGLPDDMDGEKIQSYQNIRELTVESVGVSFEPTVSFSAGVGNKGVGLTAQARAEMGFTKDFSSYTGKAIGVSVGGGVYAGVQAGPFSAGGDAHVTLSAHSSSGGNLSTYAGFSGGLSLGDYGSIGFGKSVNRTFNTINGWDNPVVSGRLNIGHVSREIHRDFIGSVSNSVPQVTVPYRYSSDGRAYRLKLGVSLGILEGLGLDLGMGVTATSATSTTTYEPVNEHRGFGYMYYEKARGGDMLDFTRDNDGGLNQDLPFMPAAMKTYDVFSSTAHGASHVFRADRNDFGIVRDPELRFENTSLFNELHQVQVKLHVELLCWVGISGRYDNIRTRTEGNVQIGASGDDRVNYRSSVPRGVDQNVYFKTCGTPSLADELYLSQVNKYGFYAQQKDLKQKGFSARKRALQAEPLVIYTNADIRDFPQMVIPRDLLSYKEGEFPLSTTSVDTLDRGLDSHIGAIMNVNREGKIYVYSTPVMNRIKNDVAFRVNAFHAPGYQLREGIMSTSSLAAYASPDNTEPRDHLFKNTLTPAYATSYLLNAVLSPDYVDVLHDGISDDDLGSYLKFHYTRISDDYRWRVPYADQNNNVAFLNPGLSLNHFDDMGSYTVGSKEIWYAHSMESRDQVVEFYISDRADGRDSRSKIMEGDHPHALAPFSEDKETHSRMQKLDSIKVYQKNDRYIHGELAGALKTIYFDYDYGISSGVWNSDSSGKLRLTRVRVRHGQEPLAYAQSYDFDYNSLNPSYGLGNKDGWGNYYPNRRPLPLCAFPYIDQWDRSDKDSLASAFHLTSIRLPSGGTISVEYEADDYAYVQDRRAMAMTPVVGVGKTPHLVETDALGLYSDRGRDQHLYIYVRKPAGLQGDYKRFLLNGSSQMYFSFNMNIAGDAFDDFDQVKGYAEVSSIGTCPNSSDHLYIEVKPVPLQGTEVRPSPMVNTGINTARAYASDQLYFQQREHPDGHNRNHFDRLKKASLQVADAVLGRNSIPELMKDYSASRYFHASKSYVRLALTEPKIGGGSRVSSLRFSDEWSAKSFGESSSLVGYNYHYVLEDGRSSGVASYEPLLGGEENPFRSGHSYALSNNSSKYPPYDPVELIKEEPIGESFFPVGSVGYSRVVVESIHKQEGRSSQSFSVQEFYTARDFPYVASYSPRKVKMEIDEQKSNPGLRDIMLSFLGIGSQVSSSANRFEIRQEFLVETNDMHGKAKGEFRYELLPRDGRVRLVSSTEYFYHSNGNGRLVNEVPVIEYHDRVGTPASCLDPSIGDNFPRHHVTVVPRTVGVDVDVCTDSREVVTQESRTISQRGGGLKFCLPPLVKPEFTWTDDVHHHTDYFRSNTTTKVVHRYGILQSVRHFSEGSETLLSNKYYDGLTGSAVVQVVKDGYGDDLYTTQIPAYWTSTDLEGASSSYPLMATGADAQDLLGTTLNFSLMGSRPLDNDSFIQARFVTTQDVFHVGDELFVKAIKNGSGSYQWFRLYVTDVEARKPHKDAQSPLTRRYGGDLSSGAEFRVSISGHRVHGSGDIQAGDELSSMLTLFKYRSGRKNMLNVSGGQYVATRDPLIPEGTDYIPAWNEGCSVRSFQIPAVDAEAVRYRGVQGLAEGTTSSGSLNPVSLGAVNRPYLGDRYILTGDRGYPMAAANIVRQRGHGLLRHWYYWLDSHYDSTTDFGPLKPLLTRWDNPVFLEVSTRGDLASWRQSSEVTKAIPTLGAVEERDILGIYQSVFVDPRCGLVRHTTQNGRFGQSWVETFEDMSTLFSVNGHTDFLYSPFLEQMTRTSTVVAGYEVIENSQSHSSGVLQGSFLLDQTVAHSGLYSLRVSPGNPLKVFLLARSHQGPLAYSRQFDFALTGSGGQLYTAEVWARRQSNDVPQSPTVVVGSTGHVMEVQSMSIDGWTLFRVSFPVSDLDAVRLEFPGNQHYDDLRVYPASATIKAYVYHPFQSYLMAVLDEQNFATFYEYNSRNQLVRLKKETEKGVMTMAENIKNIGSK